MLSSSLRNSLKQRVSSGIRSAGSGSGFGSLGVLRSVSPSNAISKKSGIHLQSIRLYENYMSEAFTPPSASKSKTTKTTKTTAAASKKSYTKAATSSPAKTAAASELSKSQQSYSIDPSINIASTDFINSSSEPTHFMIFQVIKIHHQ
ncbi:unnamed protein product [[Candida] boidinii]|nr:unnamed protein product [[Candida] boidinii]